MPRLSGHVEWCRRRKRVDRREGRATLRRLPLLDYFLLRVVALVLACDN